MNQAGTGPNRWTHLWKVNVPLKIKNFVWRLMNNNILPVKARLREKGLTITNSCQRCEEELVQHLFFECDKIERYSRILGIRVQNARVGRLLQWLENFVMNHLKQEVAEIFGFLWHLWQEQNELL